MYKYIVYLIFTLHIGDIYCIYNLIKPSQQFYDIGITIIIIVLQ